MYLMSVRVDDAPAADPSTTVTGRLPGERLPDPMELYIIRHAESENNARPQEERTDDPSLSALGYRQAEYLVNRIRHLRPTRIFVSP
ncbi:MAG: histidine phosphatase family protein, partial [Gemmatimonadetes bacterium]|nr:histidine phosphatase family protein [Gemmatimonadota bacterium]